MVTTNLEIRNYIPKLELLNLKKMCIINIL